MASIYITSQNIKARIAGVVSEAKVAQKEAVALGKNAAMQEVIPAYEEFIKAGEKAVARLERAKANFAKERGW